jgi:hypothetical protein
VDTSELLKLGARAMVVNLCKQLEDVIALVPDLKMFTRDLVRESIGYKPTGAAARKGAVNGTTRERLADQLIEARRQRAKKASAARQPMTDAQRALMSRLAKKRWAAAKKFGVGGGKLPRNADIGRAPSKSHPPKPAAPTGGAAATE